jgi:hypothetical protein
MVMGDAKSKSGAVHGRFIWRRLSPWEAASWLTLRRLPLCAKCATAVAISRRRVHCAGGSLSLAVRVAA